jgi:hypothetical protein
MLGGVEDFSCGGRQSNLKSFTSGTVAEGKRCTDGVRQKEGANEAPAPYPEVS